MEVKNPLFKEDFGLSNTTNVQMTETENNKEEASKDTEEKTEK